MLNPRLCMSRSVFRIVASLEDEVTSVRSKGPWSHICPLYLWVVERSILPDCDVLMRCRERRKLLKSSMMLRLVGMWAVDICKRTDPCIYCKNIGKKQISLLSGESTSILIKWRGRLALDNFLVACLCW